MSELSSTAGSFTATASETSPSTTCVTSENNRSNCSHPNPCGYEASRMWPVLTYIAVLMVISLVGNSLVLAIFNCRWRSSKGATKVYVCALAIFDLTSTVMVMPRELMVLSSFSPGNYGVSLDAYCALTFAVTLTCHVSSGSVLLLIAARRLMKATHDTSRASADEARFKGRSSTSSFSSRCRLARLVTSGQGAKVTSVAVCVLAFACCSPTLAVYANNPASHCTCSNQTDGCFACGGRVGRTSVLQGFSWFVVLAFVAVAGGTVVLYALVALRLRAQRRGQREQRELSRASHRRSICRALSEDRASDHLAARGSDSALASPGLGPTTPRLPSPNGVTHSGGDDSARDNQAFFPPLSYSVSYISSASVDDDDERDEGKVSGGNPNVVASGCPSVTSSQRSRKNKTDQRVDNTTLVLMCITVIYILSYPPYLALSYLQVHGTTWCYLQNQSPSMYIVVELFRRSYLISNAANPLVYVLFNHTFRKVLWKTMHLRRQVI